MNGDRFWLFKPLKPRLNEGPSEEILEKIWPAEKAARQRIFSDRDNHRESPTLDREKERSLPWLFDSLRWL